MIEKLKLIAERYEEINTQLSDPGIINDQNLYATLMKEYKKLTPIVEKFHHYQMVYSRFTEAEEMMKESDPELRELAESEYKENKAAL